MGFEDPVCVIPVAAADAIAWAEGRLEDRDLLLRTPLRPEAVFALNLPPGRAALRQCLGQIAYWHQRGAVCLIARASGPIVQHYLKLKALPVLKEVHRQGIQYRFFGPPAAFAAWMAKFSKRPLADLTRSGAGARIPAPGLPLRDPLAPHVQTPPE